MKQVIIIRKDLNMRKGKMIVQGAHASLNAVLGVMDKYTEWLSLGQKKICVGVNSMLELQDVYNQAKVKNLPCSIILDAGLTEFKEPTYTAVAIGPTNDEYIDQITGHLKLL